MRVMESPAKLVSRRSAGALRITTSTSSTINGPFTETVRDCLPFSRSHQYRPSEPGPALMQS
jgi:hypothetical protein